ncbi:hypothetical protein BX286_3418 [Streptomyces sp. 3211.6]|uniref:hypothetical protein n=1 Tax=Streptomyces sp. 3211.6 TaxID=1938845 RepID=UPI000EADC362|nr:hypothetical protein [Streptomyces sp. 3211.6]RKT05422.1 hypothetical protein BX286_3418 [Streptomyces sp. 3211.6]
MTPDAPPTPEEIARAFALQQEHAAAEPRDRQSGAAIARRLYGDYLSTLDPEAEGPKPGLVDFIEKLAAKESVTNADRGPHRAFWSYESKLEGVEKPVPNRFLAKACGQTRGLQVLEDTPAGHRLNGYFLGNEFVVDALARHFDFDPEELDAAHGAAWDTLSDRYALATEGLVIGFAADITADSVLGKTEIPALLKNADVGKEGIKFATPLPQHAHLPPDVNAFMAHPPIRCQLRMGDDDPGKSPEEFAMKLHAIDVPEDQKQAHAAIVDRLSTANSYEALDPTTAEAKRREHMSTFIPGVNLGHGLIRTPRSVLTGHGVSEPTPPQITPKSSGIEH